MIAAIVAVDENWGIGRNGDLLINIPEDKKFFKERTNGSIVIMGRKTWDSLPKKPLPNRKNYVISKSQKHVNGVDFISMDSAIELIQNEDSDIFIIGGGQIYEKLLPYCEKVFVTKIYKSFKSDTFFPNIEEDNTWKCVESGDIQYYQSIPYEFLTYKNRKKQEGF